MRVKLIKIIVFNAARWPYVRTRRQPGERNQAIDIRGRLRWKVLSLDCVAPMSGWRMTVSAQNRKFIARLADLVRASTDAERRSAANARTAVSATFAVCSAEPRRSPPKSDRKRRSDERGLRRLERCARRLGRGLPLPAECRATKLDHARGRDNPSGECLSRRSNRPPLAGIRRHSMSAFRGTW
jgi:hypothetical protein